MNSGGCVFFCFCSGASAASSRGASRSRQQRSQSDDAGSAAAAQPGGVGSASSLEPSSRGSGVALEACHNQQSSAELGGCNSADDARADRTNAAARLSEAFDRVAQAAGGLLQAQSSLRGAADDAATAARDLDSLHLHERENLDPAAAVNHRQRATAPPLVPTSDDGGSGDGHDATDGRSGAARDNRDGSGPAAPATPALERGPERLLVVKFLPARLDAQSEQFASELARHLGLPAPACRILRKKVLPAEAEPLFSSSFLLARLFHLSSRISRRRTV